MRWYKALWFKLVLEVFVTGLLWIAYFIVRHLLPKKYRMKDKSIKSLVRDFAVLTSNIAKKDDGVGEVLGKAKNVFDHFYELRNHISNSHQEYKTFLRDLIDPVDEHKNYSFMSLVFPKLEKYGKCEIMQEINLYSHICRYTFDIKGEIVIFYTIRNTSDRSENSSHDSYFAVTAGYNYLKLTNLLFDMVDGRLYLSAKSGDKLVVEKLDQEVNQQDFIMDDKLFTSLTTEIDRFKAQGIQRSYILYGLPGTGKSSFCLELSKRVSGKILKIDSNTFNNLSNQGTRVLIENLDCDFIIVDDIDKISTSDLPAFLYTLEAIKSFARKPTLLATVNDMGRLDRAVIRPGRFDDIIEFKLPNYNQRRAFIKSILAKFNVSLPAEELNMFAKVTDGMSQAYLKEYCQQCRIELDFPTLLIKIGNRKKYLKVLNARMEEDDGGSYDEDDDD